MFVYIFQKKSASYAICPFCNALSDDNDPIIQYDDYVEVPMIWCDNCGARAVLKASIDAIHAIQEDADNDDRKQTIDEHIAHTYMQTMKITNIYADDFNKLFEETINKCTKLLSRGNSSLEETQHSIRNDILSGGINVYKIPLIKVKKVTGVEIFSKHCYCELAQQEVVEYYNSMSGGFCGRMYPTELEEKLGIFDVPNSSEEEDYSNTYAQDAKLREYIESKNPEIHGKKSGTLEACKPVSNPLSLETIIKEVEIELKTQPDMKTYFYNSIKSYYKYMSYTDEQHNHYYGSDAMARLNMNIGLACNSYNISAPETPYPSMFSEAHDGVHMHALLEDNEIVSYWGD
jgi:hypothetical protein